MSGSPKNSKSWPSTLLLVQLRRPPLHPPPSVSGVHRAALHSARSSCLNSLSEFLCRGIPRLSVSVLLFRLHTSGQTEFGLVCLGNGATSPISLEQPGVLGEMPWATFYRMFLALPPSRKWRSLRSELQPCSPPSSGSWQVFKLSILPSLNSSRRKITSSRVHSKPVSEKRCLPV